MPSFYWIREKKVSAEPQGPLGRWMIHPTVRGHNPAPVDAGR